MRYRFFDVPIKVIGFLILLAGALATLGGCAWLQDLLNPSPGGINVADVVKVVGTGDAGLHVRDAPAGEVFQTIPDGWVLQIIGGPETAMLNGETYDWWRVQAEKFDAFPSDGWVAGRFLTKVFGAQLLPNSLPDYFKNAGTQIEAAISWATSKARATEDWAILCLGFVAKAFTGSTYTGWGCPEEGVDYSCPMGGVEKLTAEGKFYAASNCWNPPRGALLFFSGQGICEGIDMATHGHIGIYLGNGEVVHAYGSARTQDIQDVIQLDYIDSYIGWAYPLSEWFASTAGLVAYYRFDNTCEDSSGSANHGSPIGEVAFTPGRVGQALKLYGISNSGYIRVSNSTSLEFSNELTVSFFLRMDGSHGQTGADCSGSVVDKAYQTVFAKRGDRKGFYTNIIVNPDTTEVNTQFCINAYDTPRLQLYHAFPYEIGEWIHLAFVIDSGTVIEYVNGIEVTREVNQNISFARANSEDLYIGIQNNPEAGLDFWFPLNGAIDELRFYTRAFSPTEIAILYGL